MHKKIEQSKERIRAATKELQQVMFMCEAAKEELQQAEKALVELEASVDALYSIGDKFERTSAVFGYSQYMLATTGERKVALINLKNGGQFSKYVAVKSVHCITQEEFNIMQGTAAGEFKPIPK